MANRKFSCRYALNPGLGAGGIVRPVWQSSSDGTTWGDLVSGATMIATGVRVVSMAGGIGQYARARWTASTTGVKFGMPFVLKQ